MMKIPFVTWVILSQIVVGCQAEGVRLANAFWWMMDHPGLTIALLSALTPLIALIPVVGAPFAAVWTKVIIALSPVIKELAKAYEEDSSEKRPDDIEDAIVKDPGTRIGSIPGTRIFARIAARRIARRRK